MSSTTHFGFDYSGNGIKSKACAIVDWSQPTSQKEVRSFLGLANFYCCFIPQFSSIAAPLNDLTSSKVAFRWTDQHQAACSKLKDALSSLPILDYPRRFDTFMLTTDASEHGLDAVPWLLLRESIVLSENKSVSRVNRATMRQCLGFLVTHTLA